MLARLKFDIDPLVNNILDQIPQDLIINGRVLDPAIGGGQFVAEVERRKRAAGKTDEEIKNSVYGFESNILRLEFAVNKNKLAGTYLIGGINELDAVNMKFDVIVGNPPFNANDTVREGKKHRGQGQNLAKKFFELSLKLGSQHVALIAPYGHRTFTNKLAKNYMKHGLYKIYSCSDYFKQVQTNPCVFLFDIKNPTTKIANELVTDELEIPDNNLGKIFRNQPGVLNREDYETTLLDNGNQQIIVTTAVIKYTNDLNFNSLMKDKTVGNWRVVFNCTTSKKSIGKVIVADPNAILSKSVHCLIVNNKQEAEIIKDYLETDEVRDILIKVKTSACNSKKFISYLENPIKTVASNTVIT